MRKRTLRVHKASDSPSGFQRFMDDYARVLCEGHFREAKVWVAGGVGDTLVVTIPKVIAQLCGIKKGDRLALFIAQGRLVIAQVPGEEET